ncbi:hypothetical protein K440DRAFT_155083 [Wilcoxina mikolae CBS 423.85]|nr:hypothetical protein K440DRAFT_155083 [Wilcoxina mikolae CBS 423.85]
MEAIIKGISAYAGSKPAMTLVPSLSILVIGVMTIWDNRSGRNHAVNALETKMDGVKEGLQKEVKDAKKDLKMDIGRLDQKVDLLDKKVDHTQGTVMLFGETILKSHNGDKKQLQEVLKTLAEPCQEEGGC